MADELLTRNAATAVRLSASRKHKRASWSVEEARAFLESARHDSNPLCAVNDQLNLGIGQHLLSNP